MKKLTTSLIDNQFVGQEQLLKYIQSLREADQNSIMNKLQKYDLKQLYQVYQQFRQKIVQKTLFERIRCLEFDQKDEEIGYQIIAEGKLAIVLSARQNISLLDIKLPSHKCLFQLFCERIWSLQNLVRQHQGQCLPILIFIMTTNVNHDMITTFFKMKNNFGLQEDQIFFIQQDILPLFSIDGKILFMNESEIIDESIGNGYIYLNQSILDTMKCLGISILHLCSIENILCKFGDPNWIGAFIRNQLYLSAKCVEKSSLDENLGMIVNQLNCGLQFKEYDEISYNDLVQRDNDGNLINSNGVIGQVMCLLDYAIQLCSNFKKQILSNFHIRQMKFTYFDYINSRCNIPNSKPNALKFELTYYEAIPYCPIQQFGLFRVKREDEYAPILNSSNESKDNIHTARQAYIRRDQKWVSQLGYEINSEFEISPKLTYFGEGLEEAIKKQIKNQLSIPFILHSDKQIRTLRINSAQNQQSQKSSKKYSSQCINAQKYQQQKMSINQSLNHLEQSINRSLVTPNINQSFQLPGRKSIDQIPNGQTDHYQRSNLNQYNKPLYYVPNSYYLPKK